MLSCNHGHQESFHQMPQLAPQMRLVFPSPLGYLNANLFTMCAFTSGSSSTYLSRTRQHSYEMLRGRFGKAPPRSCSQGDAICGSAASSKAPCYLAVHCKSVGNHREEPTYLTLKVENMMNYSKGILFERSSSYLQRLSCLKYLGLQCL